mgnify:CR=1 FL=1
MNVLIFGASGMIGLYLVDDLLKAGHNVIATGRKQNVRQYFAKRNIQYLTVDISKREDFEKLPQEGIDVVIHLSAVMPATMNGYDPYRYFEVNTVGTLNVLEYCRKAKVRQILYTESHSDMGGYWGKKVIGAYDPYSVLYGNDHTVYIISKIAGLELIKHYHSESGISYAVFRCPNIYSYHPEQTYCVDGKPVKVAYRELIRKAMNSETIEIWGDCSVRKDIVYVKDLIQMMLKSIEKKIEAGIYNVSTGEATSLEEQILGIIDVFSPVNNKSKVVYRPDKKVHLNNHRYDISNAIKDLGYHPEYTYREMLEDMKKEMQSDRFSCIE